MTFETNYLLPTTWPIQEIFVPLHPDTRPGKQ